jgi:protein gp37/ParB-like chromosome segregation protein Spo0J
MIRFVPTAELFTREPFDSLFSIDPKVLDAIQESMESGFDASYPILTWKGEGVVIDGHTRLRAAEIIGIVEVPIVEREFEDEAQAIEFAIRHQRDRRNRKLTNAEIMRCVRAVHKAKKAGRLKCGEELGSVEPNSKGRARDETASIVGISAMTVKRVLAIEADGDEVLKAAVVRGDMSIFEAYKEVLDEKRHTAESQPQSPDVAASDSDERVDERPESFVLDGTPEPKRYPPARFNRTNDMVEWALWTWNPVTGCEHNCVYCYARDIANRFYPEKFVPTFHPERLNAPRHMKVPEAARDNIGEKNVFVCSMADLFGRWVPDEWIESVMAEVRNSPQWNFLFLSKFPLRYEGIDFPDNAWVGTSVDEQRRVASAEKAFRNVKAKVKWLSCEPLRERLTFKSLEMFDWVVIGGQSVSSQAPAFQPPWEWVEHLHTQARAAGCQIYWKPNLETRPREYPGQQIELADFPSDRSESDHERAIAP